MPASVKAVGRTTKWSQCQVLTEFVVILPHVEARMCPLHIFEGALRNALPL